MQRTRFTHTLIITTYSTKCIRKYIYNIKLVITFVFCAMCLVCVHTHTPTHTHTHTHTHTRPLMPHLSAVNRCPRNQRDGDSRSVTGRVLRLLVTHSGECGVCVCVSVCMIVCVCECMCVCVCVCLCVCCKAGWLS